MFRNNIKNNKGFSLVEVMVAITVLSIIALPLANSFIHATKLNAKARQVRSANVVAQTILEDFKSKPLDTLIAESKDTYGNVYYVHNDEEVDGAGNVTVQESYVFRKFGYDENGLLLLQDSVPYIKGQNNEKFFVDITMTPEAYAVNNYCVPLVSDIYYKGNIMINADLSIYDATAISRFNIDYGISRDKIKKETTLVIETKVIDSATEATTYETVLNLYFKYEANGTVLNYRKYVTSKTVTELSDLPKVYLLYTVFDKYSNNTDFVAEDKINVEFSYLTDSSNLPSKTMDVYVIEQETTGVNSLSQEGTMHILNTNLVGKMTKKDTLGNNEQTVDPSNHLFVYSNVLNVDNLTQGNEKKNSLYKVTVVVYADSAKTNELLTVSTTKEIIYAR